VLDDDTFSRRLKAHLNTPTLTIFDGAARADGILILSTSKGLVAWHSELDSFDRVITYGGDLSGALARVPGGVARDPWTRRPLAADLVKPPSSQSNLDPLGAQPPALSGGLALDPASDADGGCAGCASAAQPRSPLSDAAPLLLLALTLIRRRRVS
jgi:MYXO-CTERM domain-containing protein